MIFVFFIGTILSYGQNKGHWEKIKSLKVAFFTEKLSLSSKEAKDFWPIYDTYENELHKLYENQKTKRSKYDYDNLSEADSKYLLETYLDFEKEKIDLSKKYYAKISKVLTYGKTYKLIRVEEDFRRRLIRQYRHRGRKTKK